MPGTITLSEQQSRIIDGVMDLLKHQWTKEVSIGGLAGTGKSTLAKYLIKELTFNMMTYMVLTPTGKAANVLRNKGVYADTIHSAIYTFKGEYEDEHTGKPYIVWGENEQIRLELPNVFIVDEASMVDHRVATDLRALGAKIVWIGDYGQLPPVGRDPGIMQHPDFRLTEIFRQSKGNGIIDFAHDIRNGTPWSRMYSDVELVSGTISEVITHLKFDQAICGVNAFRIKFNKIYRKLNKHKSILDEGERIICLHNNRRYGIFNGMQLLVKTIYDITLDHIICDVELDNEETRKVHLRKSAFHNQLPDKKDTEKNEIIADYSYCITCHKSQGSEWDSVLVFNQENKLWDHTRWLYTAATRAKDKLTIIT